MQREHPDADQHHRHQHLDQREAVVATIVNVQRRHDDPFQRKTRTAAVGPKTVTARAVKVRFGWPRKTVPLAGVPLTSVNMPSAVNITAPAAVNDTGVA